jgi:methylated-DNA-protein-cysteine methyltransferase-like protein
MARSDEAAAFFHAVYSAVQEIPHGKVTSYGHIAKLVGTRVYHPALPNTLRTCNHLLTRKQPNAPARSESA